MTKQNDNQIEKRISSLLCSIDRETNEPNKQFLQKLGERSESEFVAHSAHNSKKSEKIINLSKWRIIMKSKITTITAAVVIIILILLSLHDGSVDIASNVYAEITENMQEMPWVHIRIITEYPTIDERIAEVDIWYSNNEQVIGMKDSIRVKFSYYRNEKKYDYDSDTNSITVSSISEDDYSNSLINLKEGFDSWLKQYGQQGTEINHYLGEFEGEKVEIYETQEERGSGKIYVNPVSRLPIHAEFKDTYQGNQGNVQFHFEFPESGPEDIYDLGVPRDAPIIEN
jgi:hypothetical protein